MSLRWIAVVPALWVASASAAGPLSPPAGPVTSTGKTLTEVEPRIAISNANTPGDADSVFRIAAPGSYYLTGNVSSVSGRTTIEIASSHVEIDLNGFTMFGAAGAVAAIRCDATGLSGITVRNGVVTGFPGASIDLELPIVQGCLIEKVHAIGNDFRGIRAGNNAIVRDCIAESNGNFGISVGVNGIVSGCVSRNNIGDGFVSAFGGVFTDCASTANLGRGFSHAGNGSFLNCVARGNTGVGFDASNSNVSGCTAASNAESGFAVASGVISECVAIANQRHGIIASSDSLILNNVADSNGASLADGAGILVTGSDTRVEGNNATDNDVGIRVTSAGNLIIRNSGSGNGTAYVIVANNRYGPILDISAAGGAAVNGPSAPGTLTTTDPWANFSY